MYHLIFVFLLGLGGTSLAQSLPPPVPLTPGAPAASDAPAVAAPAPQTAATAERSLGERAGAAVGKAAEEATSAFGRAMNWTGRQLESAGQW
ncbi:MAG: hypothetical protein ACKO54_09900, partial [Alphaproteobacteria bacterium]